MDLNLVVNVFIGVGFCIISIAPAFKIFKKAELNPWRSLIPGVNVFLSIRKIYKQPLGFLSLISFLTFPLFLALYAPLLVYNPEMEIPFPVAEVLGNFFIFLPVTFVIFSYLFCFPFLSTAMLFTITQLYNTPPQPTGTLLYLTVVMIVLACLQGLVDFLCWRALLKRFGRPAWQFIFPLLPFTLILVETLVSVAIRPLDILIIPPTMFIALLAGFGLYYFLGYSTKAKYLRE